MVGVLQDVFEINGRGCVVLVDVESGSCKTGDTLSVAGKSWPITGIEMPNWRPEAVRRIQEGWKPPLGLLLRGATKADLVDAVGGPCSSEMGAESHG